MVDLSKDLEERLSLVSNALVAFVGDEWIPDESRMDVEIDTPEFQGAEFGYKLAGRYKIIFRHDEGKHPGCPHCIFKFGADRQVTMDLHTLELLHGDHSSEVTKVRKFLRSEDGKWLNELLDVWERSRPDTQRLK